MQLPHGGTVTSPWKCRVRQATEHGKEEPAVTDHAALTQEEQEFAAEHCGLIDLHLKVNGLDPDKWWDVLVFGYLTAVRCWFRVPQIRRWAFPTIAKVKMRGAMCNQLQYPHTP